MKGYQLTFFTSQVPAMGMQRSATGYWKPHATVVPAAVPS